MQFIQVALFTKFRLIYASLARLSLLHVVNNIYVFTLSNYIVLLSPLLAQIWPLWAKNVKSADHSFFHLFTAPHPPLLSQNMNISGKTPWEKMLCRKSRARQKSTARNRGISAVECAMYIEQLFVAVQCRPYVLFLTVQAELFTGAKNKKLISASEQWSGIQKCWPLYNTYTHVFQVTKQMGHPTYWRSTRTRPFLFFLCIFNPPLPLNPLLLGDSVAQHILGTPNKWDTMPNYFGL